MTVWNDLVVSNSGTFISDVIDISYPEATSSNVLTWEQSNFTNTTVLVETNLSLNGGTTWLGWKMATSGSQLDDVIPLLTDLTDARLQIRVGFTATSTVALPWVRNFNLEFLCAYPEEGYWLSPIFDFVDSIPEDSSVQWDIVDVPTGCELIIEWRSSYDGVHWLEWERILSSGNPFASTSLHMQMRARLVSNDTRTKTPSVKNFRLDNNQFDFRGIWTSASIDVSHVSDSTSGKLLATYTSSGRALLVQSRTSSDEENWTLWENATADGGLVSPAGEYVQVRLLFGGLGSQVTDATLSFDGKPMVSLLQTGMTPGAEYSFTTLRDMLIVANGKDATKKWDGNTELLEPLGEEPPTLKQVVTHQNRVWGVDAENPSRVRFSDILDPETWDSLNFIDFNPEDGDYITAIYRYGQNLIVSKLRSMAILTGNKRSNYGVSWLDSEQGVSGKNAIVQADKYLVYVSQDGIRFTDLAESVVASERLIPHWENINHRKLNQAAVIYWRNMVYIALPRGNDLSNSVVWAYDFLRNAWSIYEDWGISNWLKFQQYGEQVLLGADSNTGQVYKMATTELEVDGAFVEYEWQSKDFNFGYPERYKLFRNIFMDIEGVAETATLEVTLIVDGKETGTFSDTVPAGAGDKHSRRILPPLYGAVIGSSISIKIKTRCGIHGISMEYTIRGAIPGGDA